MTLQRGEIYWADLPHPSDRRPVLVITRTRSIRSLTSIVTAPITRTIRRSPSEVSLGPDEGLRDECVVNCHGLMTVRKSDLDPSPVGRLSNEKLRELDEALRYALEIR